MCSVKQVSQGVQCQSPVVVNGYLHIEVLIHAFTSTYIFQCIYNIYIFGYIRVYLYDARMSELTGVSKTLQSRAMVYHVTKFIVLINYHGS